VSKSARRNILIVDGHPDSREGRYVHAISQAYADAATEAGHEVKTINVADWQFEWLKNADEFLKDQPSQAIAYAQSQIAWCDHIVILYPLWLGSMPALLKAFFEQVMRPNFAFKNEPGGKLPKKLLAGRSARVIVTMGMPSLFYKWYFRAHSLKSLERNILGFVGFAPIRANVIGNVEGMGPEKRQAWLKRIRQLAAAAH